MLTNYIKIALRNLLRHKTFSFINIFGLAASMSVCLLVIMLIQDAHRFDLFHPGSESTYRLLTDAIRKGGGEETYASSPHAVAEKLANDFSYVEEWVPLSSAFSGTFQSEGKKLGIDGKLTDGSFFKTFGFTLMLGDAATALTEPYSVVLTHETAERFFQNENPIGKIMESEGLGSYKVTGVLAPFPGKTHLEFEALGSISTLPALDREAGDWRWLGNFNNYYAGYNYVRLREGVTKEQAETALAEIAKTAYAGLELESRDAGYRFRLQPLGSITPGPMILSQNMGRGMPAQLLWFFSVLGMVVMLLACFNYTNLSIARSLTRAKEVGVRKVMGARRVQIFGQFLSEAVVSALFALLLAYGMLELTIPAFESLQSLNFFDTSLELDAATAGWFVGFTVAVGLMAGLMPAVVLSKFNALTVLQKLENTRLFRRMGLRKTLVVMQFAVSLVFMITLTIAWNQVNFAVQENFGAGKTTVLNLQMLGQDYSKLSAEFSQIPSVEKISAISHLMGTWQDSKDDIRVNQSDEPLGIRDYFIDHNFLPNMELELLAGENFPENPTQQKELFAIVNEKFLEQFKLGAPVEAIGKTMLIGDSTQVAIRGVVKDFLFKPLNYQLEPLLLRYNPQRLSVMNLKVSSNDLPATIAALDRSWKKFSPEIKPDYGFYDETARRTYADMVEMIWIVGYFATLGIIIACLGLLGMAIYSVETKAKEISIRKVIGAGALDLVAQLSKGYFLLLGIAALVAVPLSYLLGSQLLQTFAFHIPLNLWVFLPGVALLFLLGALTIGSQTVRAALRNPVGALRSE